MRIMNIFYNIEIKYQQHINSEKFNTMIFSLRTTLGKPTRGKLVRGNFIIGELQRNFIYSIFIFRKIHKLISDFSSAKDTF